MSMLHWSNPQDPPIHAGKKQKTPKLFGLSWLPSFQVMVELIHPLNLEIDYDERCPRCKEGFQTEAGMQVMQVMRV